MKNVYKKGLSGAKSKGFTLIELLVVIAIIGILSGIVLASLNSARTKGADAAVKANLSGIRAQAELQYSDLGCYANTGQTCSASVPAVFAAGVCPAAAVASIFGQTNVNAAIAAARTASNGLDACAATVGGGQWAVAVHLKTALKAWCVDSSGASKEVAVTDQTQGILSAKVTGGVCSAT